MIPTYQPKDVELYVDALRELYRRDFELFAREQLTITSVEPGKWLHLYPFTAPQAVLHSEAESQRRDVGYIRIVAIKGRQFGFSTYVTGKGFHSATLNQATDTLHIAQDEDTAKTIFQKVKTYYDRMDENVRPLSRFDNKKELRFENPDAKTRGRFPGLSSGMKVAHAKNILAGTGTTQHFLHLSEAAKYPPNVCDLLESSFMPSLHLQPGTVCINESTAFVEGDYFRSCCEKAMSGKSIWRFVFVPWYVEKRYKLALKKGEKFRLTPDEKQIAKLAEKGQSYGDYQVASQSISPEQFNWRRAKILDFTEDGENLFKQEYPTTYDEAWITTDLYVFKRDRLYEMRRFLANPKRLVQFAADGRVLDDPTMQFGPNHDYCAIWEEPLPGERYDMGLDTSAGLEDGDWCVAEIFKRSNHEQVAELHVHLDAMELGEKAYWLGRYFNTAQIALEMASTGFACNAQLQRLGYPYLYIWRHRERSFPTLSSYTGWKTTRESKSYMVSLFTASVNRSELTIHSHVLWNEMFNYIKILTAEAYDQFRGSKGYNDDCVMATGIAIVAADDETYGLHTPDTGVSKTRKELIAEALASGGPAFADDIDKVFDKTDKLKGYRNQLKGFD